MSFSLFNLCFALTLGGLLGFFGGIFGIGGGILAIPLLVLGFHMEQPLAQGTALVLMVPNLVMAMWRYLQRHPVAWPPLLQIGLVGSLTTWLLAGLATRLDPLTLRMAFSLAIGILSVWLLLGKRTAAGGETRIPLHRLPWVGVLGGSAMGLLGVGGGLVATPVLVGWLGLRQTLAQSLSLALVTPSALVALGTYAQAGRVDWHWGIPMAIGGLFTVSTGVACAHRLPETHLRQGFAWMLLAVSVWMAVAPVVMGR